LGAGFRQVRPVLGSAISLAVIATVGTATIAGVAASVLFGFSLKEGFLLGAILSATDGAAVFALLRGSRVPFRLARVLEGEAGLNDPVAVLLVLEVIKLIAHPGTGVGEAVGFFAQEILVGGVVGIVVGRLASTALLRTGTAPAALTLVGSLAAAAIAYGLAGVLGGSGFLAVYIAGLIVGDFDPVERPALLAFHEGLASVAEIGLFLALGVLVFPSQLGHVALKGILLAIVVAVVARPAAVGLATIRSGLTAGERTVVAWAGLRGAIPVVLATFPIIAGVTHSLEFFNIVFFAVLVSALVQGGTVEPLARRLGVIRG
jgi:cell volume regulation protein A